MRLKTGRCAYHYTNSIAHLGFKWDSHPHRGKRNRTVSSGQSKVPRRGVEPLQVRFVVCPPVPLDGAKRTRHAFLVRARLAIYQSPIAIILPRLRDALSLVCGPGGKPSPQKAIFYVSKRSVYGTSKKDGQHALARSTLHSASIPLRA